MPFFYDNISGLSGIKQYDRYLDNNLYIRNLKKYSNDPVNYQLLEMRRAIGENTSASNDNSKMLAETTKQEFENLATTICGSLEKGFTQVAGELEDINWRLNDINEGIRDVNEGISNLHSMLDWKTDILIENQRMSNLYLGKIVTLLKIPDSQKQRGYYVEQGMNYLKNAIEEGPKSDFYTDALEELTKAKQIEEKDFFSLHKLGLIHISSQKHLDVEKADLYFKASARYAKAAANVAKSFKEIGYAEEETIFSKERLIEEAASALNYSSRSNYIQIKFSDAIELARQAYDLEPSNPEYGFQLAKCLSANGQEQQAADVLAKVIELDKYYSVKALSDMDFVNKQVIRNSIEKIATSLIKKVSDEIKHLQSIIIIGSKAKDQFQKIQSLFSEPTYINARKAEVELNKVQKWDVVSYTYPNTTIYFSFTTGIVETVNKEDSIISEFILKEYEGNKLKKKFEEQDNVNKDKAGKNWEKHQAEEKRKKEIALYTKIGLTIGAIAVGAGLWFYASSMEGWFVPRLLKFGALYFLFVAGRYLYFRKPK